MKAAPLIVEEKATIELTTAPTAIAKPTFQQIIANQNYSGFWEASTCKILAAFFKDGNI